MHTGNFNIHVKYLYHLKKLNPKSSFITLESKDLWKKDIYMLQGATVWWTYVDKSFLTLWFFSRISI